MLSQCLVHNPRSIRFQQIETQMLQRNHFKTFEFLNILEVLKVFEVLKVLETYTYIRRCIVPILDFVVRSNRSAIWTNALHIDDLRRARL